MHITDRFHDSKWGVLTHYLSFVQNAAGDFHNQGVGETSWDECVEGIDVDRIAETVASTGASYLFFTMEQGTRYIIAPNKTYDEIVGGGGDTGPSKRDLVLDLHRALSKRGIDLYLYFTGSGPADDTEHGPKFGFCCGEGEVVTRPFVEKWAAVLEEYSRRYGDKVKGWWVDGCYREMFGFTDELLDLLYYAAKAGNPDAIVALNDGVDIRCRKTYANEEFTCGEFDHPTGIPEERFIDGAQTHILVPVGPVWGAPGLQKDGEYLRYYTKCVNLAGGVVTYDIAIYRDGSFDTEQIEALKMINS